MKNLNESIIYKCANALVTAYNDHQGKETGSVRLLAFRQLYIDLKELGHSYLIASAFKPEDYPTEKWYI